MGNHSGRKPARALRELEKRGLITPWQFLATRVLQQALRDRGRIFRSPRPCTIIGEGKITFRRWTKPDGLSEMSGWGFVEAKLPCSTDPDSPLWRSLDGKPSDFWSSPLCEFWCDVAEIDWNLLKERLG